MNDAGINHILVLMLENRSFDHMLGFSRLAGTDAVSGERTTIEGLTGTESNPLPTGGSTPVALGASFQLSVDPGHEFDDVVEQLCGPGARYVAGQKYPEITNSGFASRIAGKPATGQAADSATVMTGFAAEQLPVLNSLAAEFAVCDHWFSSLPGPTWPNRLFVHAGSSAGLDDSPTAWQYLGATLDGFRFENGTIFDRLTAAGKSWHLVHGDAFPQSLSLGGMLEHVLDGRSVEFEDFLTMIADPSFANSYTFIEPNYGHVLADGRNFKCGNSMHPLDDVTRGEALIKNVYEALRASAHWSDSLLIITYDEHGGFYDHVPPPTAVAPGDSIIPGLNRHGFGFDQLGVRVPTVIVSAHTPRGLIDHTIYDHTSVLATLERLFNLAPLTQRDAAAAPLDHLFELTESRQDAPTDLPQPASSGIADCADEENIQLAGSLPNMPLHLAGDLEPALAGFVQIAVARELQLAAAAGRDLSTERQRLRDVGRQIKTKFDATRFLTEVEARFRNYRTPRAT